MIPNFIIIGAARAGTTSLYHYLSQHPQVFMGPIKETLFFAYLASQAEPDNHIDPNIPWPIKSIEEYQALFTGGQGSQALGEASPLYLYAPGVPYQIKKYRPNMKLILVLRNPIERAYSVYLKNRREGLEIRSFEDAIKSEIHDPSDVIQSQSHHIRAGLYFRHVSRYLEYFPREQIHIDFYDNLKNSPKAMIANIFNFLGVNVDFDPDISVQFNKAIPSLIKNSSHRRTIKSFTSRIRNWIPQKLYFSLLNFQNRVNSSVSSYPPLSRDMRLILRDQFVEDIEHLQGLLQLDLSHWLVIE